MHARRRSTCHEPHRHESGDKQLFTALKAAPQEIGELEVERRAQLVAKFAVLSADPYRHG